MKSQESDAIQRARDSEVSVYLDLTLQKAECCRIPWLDLICRPSPRSRTMAATIRDML